VAVGVCLLVSELLAQPAPVISKVMIPAVKNIFFIESNYRQKTFLPYYKLLNRAIKILDKMPVQCLKEFEGNGIIQRKVYKVVVPKVEYSLRALGKKLRPIFNELVKFGLLHEKK
jgi:hypothetical protein